MLPAENKGVTRHEIVRPVRLDDAEHFALKELAAARGNGVPRLAVEKIHAICQREIKAAGPMPFLMPLA